MSGTVCIIQARMGSSRLPGKVLMDIAGQPMLARVVQRAQGSRLCTEVMVATSTLEGDDAVAEWCRTAGLRVFRGSESDVLSRYSGAARAAGAEVVVRVTADCPLLDSTLVDDVVRTRAAALADYASNVLAPRTYPRGVDVEAFAAASLALADAEAREAAEREHVTPFLWRRPERFRLARVAHASDQSGERWTVDTSDDLALVRAIYSELDDGGRSWLEVLDLLARRPELRALNANVEQRAL